MNFAFLQLKEMAEKLPTGTFRQFHSRSGSLSRLDVSNSALGSADFDALGAVGSEGLGLPFQQFSSNPAINVPDFEANGVASPHSASSPLSGRGSQRLDSPRSTSSPHTGTEAEIGSALGRVGGSGRMATRLAEGDTNGFDTAQRNEERIITSGTSVSFESVREPETEWVEQDEPGVYITLTALPGGGKDLKRVRFR